MHVAILHVRSLMSDGFWLVSVFIVYQLEKKHHESSSNNIVPLSHYRYSFGVDFPILIQLLRLLNCYSYR